MTARRALRLAAAAAVAFVAAACTINTRSGEFKCDNGTCPSGRVCVNAWCVADGDAASIADGADGDGAVCPSACSSCANGVCTIDCGASGSCGPKVVCPAGMACHVDCAGDNSCAGGIDCSAATACDLSCAGMGSCAGAMTCGGGACDLSCGGPSSCAGNLDCATSCKCDASCGGAGSCGGAETCPGPATCKSGGRCTSAASPCHHC